MRTTAIVRILRHPTFQFLLVWISAPVCALSGDVAGEELQAAWPGLAGWFITLVLWVLVAARSVRHQWKGLPPAYRSGWSFLRLGLLVGIGLVAVAAAVGALVVGGLLIFTP